MRRALFLWLLIVLISGGMFSIHYSQTVALQAGSCIDIPANPDYLVTENEQDAIAAINYAHALEHLPSLRLPANYYQLDPAHRQFVLLNLERTDRGLKPLQWDANLAQMATGYSRQLRDLQFFSHTSPISGTFSQRIDGNPVLANHYRLAAENLAGNPVPGAGAIYEYMYDDSVENCGHRDNILDPQLTLVGIGWVPGSPYGTISAQEFISSAPWNPYTGMEPVSAAPQAKIVPVSLSSITGKASAAQAFEVQVKDVLSIERITWFLDSIAHPVFTGETLILKLSQVSKGKHTLITYVVDAEQNYGVARFAIT